MITYPIKTINQNYVDFKLKIDTVLSISTAVDKIKSISMENSFDLILLDISLPPCREYKLNSGEELGEYIKNKLPNVKLIVITALNDNLRLLNIYYNLTPDGFLIKSDITSNSLLMTVKTVLSGDTFYSKTVSELLRKRAVQNVNLDYIDINILLELSNGFKMKELMQLIPLTKSGIEKRKHLLKQKFKIKNNSDRDLVLAAKNKGFI